ncbi:hypothetical protein Gogos_008966 [Gossypium gossypioides]|uniref:NB-ARC domain-containing protein n=1 Tax=Gossypium gossypioides TaxID=34282 RepID=A0A7J9CE63_GOSGO|nr:hypothetical protein [Gossypium gossypioides]
MGKTTLVEEVGREMEEFDQAIMVVVFGTPNTERIQMKITKALTLNFENTSKQGKATELWSRLIAEKFFIILDDLWKQYVSLHDVVLDMARWIASKENNGLKILFLDNYDSKIPIARLDLKVLHIRRASGSSNLFSLNVLSSLPDLRVLQVEEFIKVMAISTLTKLKGVEILTYMKMPAQPISLQILREVRLKSCDKLKCVFSSCLAQSLVHLEALVIRHYEELEEIIRDMEVYQEILSNITTESSLCLPSLKTLKIEGCPVLEYVFPIALAQGLSEL